MASPHVAGAAALYIATNSTLYTSAAFQDRWQIVRDTLVSAGEANTAGQALHPEPIVNVSTF